MGHEYLDYHIVFDIKITLDRKCRLVADGQKVEEQPGENTYSSVSSRGSVRMFFLLAALNDCDVKAIDIQKTYLTAPITKKYWGLSVAPNSEAISGRQQKSFELYMVYQLQEQHSDHTSVLS